MSRKDDRFKEAYLSSGFETIGDNDLVREPTAATPTTPGDADLLSIPAFPVDALPLNARRLVVEGARTVGCPEDLLAVPTLGTLSAAVGASRMLELKPGWTESAVLWLAVISPPGNKKTPAQKIATEPAWRVQARLKKQFDKERKSYEAEFRRWQAAKYRARKDGEPAPEPPTPPTMGRTVIADTTVEALMAVLVQNPRGVLNVRDELSAWVRSMDQYRSGKGADRQFWLSGWSSSAVSVDRKGISTPMFIERPFTSIVGGIQPSVLPELVAGREDGLLDRFLCSYPRPRPTRLTDNAISSHAKEHFALLYEKLAGLEMVEDQDGQQVPKTVPMSKDAWEVFKEISDQLQDEAHTPGFPIRLQGAWSKMEAYLARLSLIIALCRAVTEDGEEQVEPTDVLAALALVEYFKAHARRVHAELRGQDSDDLLARELADYLVEQGGKWADEPNKLHQALLNRANAAVPSRSDELSKKVREWARRGTWLKLGNKEWGKTNGQSHRVLSLELTNGVDGVVSRPSRLHGQRHQRHCSESKMSRAAVQGGANDVANISPRLS